MKDGVAWNHQILGGTLFVTLTGAAYCHGVHQFSKESGYSPGIPNILENEKRSLDAANG